MKDTEPDLSEFMRYSPPGKKKPCSIGQAFAILAPADGKILEAALRHDGSLFTNSAIVEWLKRRDLETNVSAIMSHKKRTCSCG